MSKNVRVLGDGDRKETAVLLLAAAEESSDFDVDVVQVSSYGGFLVPEEIAKAAGLRYEDEGVAMGHVYSDEDVESAPAEVETPDPLSSAEAEKQEQAEKQAVQDEGTQPAKKAPAKKAAAKKATARKSVK